MTILAAQLYVTDKGKFISSDIEQTATVFLPIKDEIHAEIVAMFETHTQMMEKLSKANPALYRELYLKNATHQPLRIVVRSREEMPMLTYYLECQTLTEHKQWTLFNVEENDQYYVRI